MKTELDYKSGDSILNNNDIGISPSQLSRFFSEPHLWYRTEILKDKNYAFKGNTSSYLGTIIHYIAKSFSDNYYVKKEEIFKYLFLNLTRLSDNDIIKKINIYKVEKETDPDLAEENIWTIINMYNTTNIDVTYIQYQYKIMGNALISYLNNRLNPLYTEYLNKAEIIPNYWITGTIDRVDIYGASNNIKIVDYKTTSNNTPSKTINYQYYLQLLCYAYIMKQLGYNPIEIEIIWITHNNINRVSEKTGKILQDFPTKIVSVVQKINDDHFKYITSLLHLVAETIKTGKENPKLIYLLYKDYTLKLK